MIDFSPYTTEKLFYTLCSAWNVYVKDEFRIDNEERDVIKTPVTLELLRSMLIVLFSRNDLRRMDLLACEYMSNVMIGSREFKKGKV